MSGDDLTIQTASSPVPRRGQEESARPSKATGPTELGNDVVDHEPVNTPTIQPIEQIARIESVEDRSLKIANDSFSLDRIREKVAELERALPKTSNALSFSVDEVLNRAVITVIDKKSGEVVRTLPSEEVLRFVHNIDKLRGVIFEDKS
ncbi:MAG TPA: hypothetical protein DIC49_03565 [Gammaproteobacteria bacterium]|nr:hypothetical protein [Gammaproteobacteria bacterium]